MSSQLLLRWDNHLPSFASSMKECLDAGDMTDLTISCQGRAVHCHKLILSVASPHIKDLLRVNPAQHPIIIMRDVPYADLVALLTFIYQGEVAVAEQDLPSFLRTAKALEVRGLADGYKDSQRRPSVDPSAVSSNSSAESHRLEPEVLVNEGFAEESEMFALPTASDHAGLDDISSAADERGAYSGAAATSATLRLQDNGRDDGSDRFGGADEELQLIPGASQQLDDILRRQVSLPDRGYFCPYCPREVNMRTLGKHITKTHGGMRLQCKACRELVHTRVTSPLIHHGVCVLLLFKNDQLGDQLVRRLSRQIRSIYKNRRYKSQMLRRYPDLAYFCSSFIFGRVKQACPRCGLVLWSSSMTSHLEKCGEDVIQCDFCNKHMARTRLPQHIDIYHPGKEIHNKLPGLLVEAPVSADAVLDGELDLEADDMLLQHPVFSRSPPSADEQAGGDDSSRSTGSAAIVSCSECHKQMRQNNLRRHMRDMHGTELPGNVHAPLSEHSTAEQLSDGGMSAAGGNKRYGLLQDSSRYADDDDLGLDPNADHDGGDKYAQYKGSCHLCGKVMWRKYLNSHMHSAHPGVSTADLPTVESHSMSESMDSVTSSAAAATTPTKVKVMRHCPYCWKTMWRCNIKRHIRSMHVDEAYRLTEAFDLLAEIRAGAAERGAPVPAYALSAAHDDDYIEELGSGGGEHHVFGAVVAAAQEDGDGGEDEDDGEAARLAIQEMDAMAEAEGLEAQEVPPTASLDEAVKRSERVATDSKRHEKHLKRCPFCRKLVRGCHLKRHITNWHRSQSTAAKKPTIKIRLPGTSTKTGVPGGLNPARQRTCPICLKIVVVNNLRRHMRASHPEVTEDDLVNVTQASMTGMGASAAALAARGDYIPDSPDGSDRLEIDEMNDDAVAAEISEDEGGDDEDVGEEPTTASEWSSASRRTRSCPYCDKVMASSNMARHIKTNHSDLTRPTLVGMLSAVRPVSSADGDAQMDLEGECEMADMNAEEAAAWMDAEGSPPVLERIEADQQERSADGDDSFPDADLSDNDVAAIEQEALALEEELVEKELD